MNHLFEDQNDDDNPSIFEISQEHSPRDESVPPQQPPAEENSPERMHADLVTEIPLSTDCWPREASTIRDPTTSRYSSASSGDDKDDSAERAAPPGIAPSPEQQVQNLPLQRDVTNVEMLSRSFPSFSQTQQQHQGTYQLFSQADNMFSTASPALFLSPQPEPSLAHASGSSQNPNFECDEAEKRAFQQAQEQNLRQRLEELHRTAQPALDTSVNAEDQSMFESPLHMEEYQDLFIADPDASSPKTTSLTPRTKFQMLANTGRTLTFQTPTTTVVPESNSDSPEMPGRSRSIAQAIQDETPHDERQQDPHQPEPEGSDDSQQQSSPNGSTLMQTVVQNPETKETTVIGYSKAQLPALDPIIPPPDPDLEYLDPETRRKVDELEAQTIKAKADLVKNMSPAVFAMWQRTAERR